jgi:outer membrane protein assembly factor BamB
MVCEDAVISLIKTYNLAPSTEDAITTSEYFKAYFNELRGFIPPHDLSLECVDLQGNTVWRTAPSKVDFDNYNIPSIWRISKNRIMIPTGEKKSRKFNIHSLSDGSLLGTYQFPEWAIENGHLTTQSIKLRDGTEIWPAPDETQIYLETSYWRPNRWVARKVIYSDGSILTHDGKILNLSDKTGRKIWALSLKDLGFDDKTTSIKGSLNPAPDNRIVIFIDNEDPKHFGGGWDSFISLKSEKS